MGIYKKTKTPEEHAAYMREYRANNKEKIKAINAKWWSENKDFIKLKTMVKKQETKPFKDMKELTQFDLENLNKSLKKSL
jgi:hypothetical protein